MVTENANSMDSLFRMLALEREIVSVQQQPVDLVRAKRGEMKSCYLRTSGLVYPFAGMPSVRIPE